MTDQVDLEIQKYFNHYLYNVFPKQLQEAIGNHNQNVEAHREQIKNALALASLKLKLWVVGSVFAGGVGSGVGLLKLFGG